MTTSSSWVRDVQGNDAPLFFILGPCAMENREHTLGIAQELVTLSEKLHFKLIFKSTFDKANRTALQGYRSVGFDKGLEIFAEVKEKFGVPVICDVHETWQVEKLARVVDVIQIPAFLCRQTDLLLAAGNVGKPVFIKKGQFATPEQMTHARDKVRSTGNEMVWLGERGFTFGYNNLVVGFRGFPIMKQTGAPVVFDVTHAVQHPGGQGNATGGDRRFVPPLAISGVAQGLAGIFMEVHENPDKALSDGPNSIRMSQLEPLLKHLIELDAWVKARQMPQAT